MFADTWGEKINWFVWVRERERENAFADSSYAIKLLFVLIVSRIFTFFVMKFHLKVSIEKSFVKIKNKSQATTLTYDFNLCITCGGFNNDKSKIYDKILIESQLLIKSQLAFEGAYWAIRDKIAWHADVESLRT